MEDCSSATLNPFSNRSSVPNVRPASLVLTSMAEVEKLLTVGTEALQPARSGLPQLRLREAACVFLEATHIRIQDLDSVRHRLLVSSAKGGRQRYTLLSDNLVTLLRQYHRKFHPKTFLFPGIRYLLIPLNKEHWPGHLLWRRSQSWTARSRMESIACVIPSQPTSAWKNGIEDHHRAGCYWGTLHSIPHGRLSARVRAERVAQIQSVPLGLLDLKSPLIPAMSCHSGSSPPELTVAQVLKVFLPEYLGRYALPAHHLKVLRRACEAQCVAPARTGLDGVAMSAVPPLPLASDLTVAATGIVPPASISASLQWLAHQRRAVLPVRYFHWVFTLPAVLRPLALQNPAALLPFAL